MGRDLRSIDPDSVYHVVSKGNDGGALARDRHDRDSLYHELDKAATRYAWEVFAWCFMNTHYHIVLRAPGGGFSDGLREINGNHSRRTGRRHGTTGHLVRNRFYSVGVDSDAHFVAAVLYVVRNPVAAGLCARAEAWRDSSYRATVGREPAPSWLAAGAVLDRFGRSVEAARLEFARLVRGGHLLVSDTDWERPPTEPPPLTI